MVKILLCVNIALVGVEILYIKKILDVSSKPQPAMYVEVPVYIPTPSQKPEVDQEIDPTPEPETPTPDKPTTTDTDADKKLIDLIISSEGFYSKPYICPAGRWTIGYGFTQPKYLQMKKMTKEKALEILRTELIPHYRELIHKYVRVPLNKHQENALISFTFNLGEGCLMKICDSSKNRLNSGNYSIVPKVMKLYCKAKVDGKYTTLKGLQIRRQKESEMFIQN